MSYLRAFLFGLVLGLLVLNCGACTPQQARSAADEAKLVALKGLVDATNTAHKLEDDAGLVIERECTPAFKAASSAAELAEVKRRCLPSMQATKALRAGRLGAMGIIATAQAGEDPSVTNLITAARGIAAAARVAAEAAAALETSP